MSSIERGQVYMLGAGPGDPGLLTVRAAAVLEAAEVVFHDQLVSPEVLAVCSAGAQLVDVGHRAGEPKREPSQVASAMAERWRGGQLVARLKGGDPFVFGRGGEELEQLLALGVPCAVVPGVTSAVAGPAAAGIPLTHRGLAASVAFVTGHGGSGGSDWGRLRADTLVVLMAAGRLGQVSQEMMAGGWDGSTPAAVITGATTSAQRQVVSRLDSVAEDAERAQLCAPALLVVGAVVELSPRLLRQVRG